MMQDHCRGQMKRGAEIEECGRVLRTDGQCDNEAEHVAKEAKKKG